MWLLCQNQCLSSLTLCSFCFTASSSSLCTPCLDFLVSRVDCGVPQRQGYMFSSQLSIDFWVTFSLCIPRKEDLVSLPPWINLLWFTDAGAPSKHSMSCGQTKVSKMFISQKKERRELRKGEHWPTFVHLLPTVLLCSRWYDECKRISPWTLRPWLWRPERPRRGHFWAMWNRTELCGQDAFS